MNKMNEIQEQSGRAYTVFLPQEPEANTPWPLILLNGDPSMLELLERENLLPLKRCLAVMPLSENRLDDFTPWPKQALNSRFPDFGGKAEIYLSWMVTVLLPHIWREYPVCTSSDGTGMLGQSLGGLLALYSQTVYAGKAFGHAAAISPSCWYPGFLSYMEKNLPKRWDTRWYLSCGTEEGKGQVGVKQSAVLQSRRMMELLAKQYGTNHVAVQWDKGGHHDNLPLRYKHALSWMENGLLTGKENLPCEMPQKNVSLDDV